MLLMYKLSHLKMACFAECLGFVAKWTCVAHTEQLSSTSMRTCVQARPNECICALPAYLVS